ncbi:radical SAM protein [Burkholderia sp. Bp8986]|uniref:B12-binding domain-containing radical SAM protein n=1 Tax=Burkholderia sp. Bp8986 TaxID=2184550 RepID=UPI000F597B91|nr:cobalamin-dependent protein [Burkholderia sp. Bp8986]RQS43262.1 radical SAM protein [Burkholderia sp. Bp8986]
MSEPRTVVFFVNPPNSNDLNTHDADEIVVSKGVQHTDWANFPHLGILSLASYVNSLSNLEGHYVDGVIHPPDRIIDTIRERAPKTLAVCLGAITANYESAIHIARAVKAIDSRIAVVIGNDHFTALSHEVLSRHSTVIDCGFVGNEVYSGLGDYLLDLQQSRTTGIYPGSVRWEAGRIVSDPAIREKINQIIEYGLIDRTLPHSAVYTKNFTRRLGGRIFELTGHRVKKGVPVEIGRGCIKFGGDDACSFCSIQYGGMWKNELPAEHAWSAIHRAWEAGYDYLYITADELPLTFARLMLDMAEAPPAWWQALPPDERPVLVGYARADGMEKEKVLKAMHNIGFRILFVGVDAGAAPSLQALNKPLRNSDPSAAAQRMHDANLRALSNARKHGMAIKAGFVLGHLGMNETLLEQNIATYFEFLQTGRDVIVSADIELLSPEPGSKDFLYLTCPEEANAMAKRLGLDIGSPSLRQHIAGRYQHVDIFDRENAIEDYVSAFMPELSKERLAAARDRVRRECGRLGIVVGDDL